MKPSGSGDSTCVFVCEGFRFLKNPISLTNKELLIFSIQSPVSFCHERSQFLIVLTISLGGLVGTQGNLEARLSQSEERAEGLADVHTLVDSAQPWVPSVQTWSGWGPSSLLECTLSHIQFAGLGWPLSARYLATVITKYLYSVFAKE